jgi:hypothetical protein
LPQTAAREHRRHGAYHGAEVQAEPGAILKIGDGVGMAAREHQQGVELLQSVFYGSRGTLRAEE